MIHIAGMVKQLHY